MTNQNGILGGLVKWFTQPFQAGGTALNWVLFVGLLIIAAWMWNTVLIRLADATEIIA